MEENNKKHDKEFAPARCPPVRSARRIAWGRQIVKFIFSCLFVWTMIFVFIGAIDGDNETQLAPRIISGTRSLGFVAEEVVRAEIEKMAWAADRGIEDGDLVSIVLGYNALMILKVVHPTVLVLDVLTSPFRGAARALDRYAIREEGTQIPPRHAPVRTYLMALGKSGVDAAHAEYYTLRFLARVAAAQNGARFP